MFTRKFLNIMISTLVLVSLIFGGGGQALAQKGQVPPSARISDVSAMPMNPTDETKVPHYFGPYPNWANSPQTLADATVAISGNGSGATASATVDPITGGVASFTITNPGSDYTFANVSVTGAGSGATGTAVINRSGVVTAIAVGDPGGGYIQPVVTISGGGVLPPATPASVSPVAAHTFNVSSGSASGGTFILSVDGAPSAPIAWNATAGEVQGALAGSSVSGSSPWDVTFGVAPSSFTIDGAGLTQAVLDSSIAATGVPEIYNVSAGSASGGNFTLNVDGVVTLPLAWNASASDIETALSLPASSVSGTGSIADPWVITFASAPLAVSMDGAGLTQAVSDASIAAAATFSVNVGSANGGTFTLSVDGTPTALLAWNASAGDVQAALAGSSVTGSGSILDPWVVTFALAPASFTIDGSGLTQAMGPLVNATATAYGGVDAITVIDGGTLYTANATVDFDLPDDPNGVKASGTVSVDVNGVVTGVTVVNPGSGYLAPPAVTIIDGMTRWDVGPGSGATATATLKITSIALDTFGSGYVSVPSVSISDAIGSGSGATATATTDVGAITAITVDASGSGYLTPGLKKFVDGLPGLCNPPACPTSGKYIPLGVPDTASYASSDTYEIGLVQYHMAFSSQMPAALVRGYVQLETPANAAISQHFPLVNELLDGTSIPALVNGVQAYGVTSPQYLGPTIVATKDKPVRIVFHNLLPTGEAGNLFLPVDSTIMGSGMGPMDMPAPADNGTVMDEVRNPMCSEPGMKSSMGCFTDNRATLHLHGGVTPWISDGTPHQWITPANEMTAYPQGVSVENVPDMNLCGANDDGCQTFFYTNQQSARLMFYHDHAWGITRLNVYAGEAAGYLITDPTEQKLIGTGGALAGLGYGIPLVIQDKTFVSSKIAQQDPTWDTARWGGEGSLWSPHVYMPAQNPGDPSGMSSFGRWMYGPWFWPPATNVAYQPIANPYYNSACKLDDPSTWQYQTDPFCEPELIPGTPNVSVGMEAFNDTPIVNGTAYPTITLDPKSYRLRILNAAGDRFWNLQWYVGDPSTANPITGATEVALNAAELAAAQTDPNIFPTPDTSKSPAGPNWIQIGTEGGFLPAPVVVPNQPTTWIIDPTRFDVGNVDKHSLLLAPAERADVIVDFSKYAGKTLILYNDAPAAFPARVAGYDYYTGGPDLSPVGAPTTLPGYGPNTRTIMQVKIASSAPAPVFNQTALNNAFKHHADGSGVFESGQHPIIVGQAAYNTAYGTNFASGSWCNRPGSTSKICDGLARIQEGSQPTDLFGFNGLSAAYASGVGKLQIPFQPKGIHDEMNAASFDEYGRMMANLGLEAPGANPLLQNIILYPYINPSTEIIDATNLPKGDLNVKPISSATDGTQIWKITHNGVDTHPIHFHMYDVQIINRVTWDNIIIPTEPSELGWKDTIRVSPLEDTIVALRPIIPTLPFEVPNSIRELSPMMPLHSTLGFNNVDQNGDPTDPITNELVNFGWEYVYHCHILSHEEMDMMRPVTVALPPNKPDGLAWSVIGNDIALTWNDNSITETSFVVQRLNGTGTWTDLATIASPLDQPNTKGLRTYTDMTPRTSVTQYRVVANNTVGYGGAYMSMTVQSAPSNVVVLNPPIAPSNLTAVVAGPPLQVNLAWTDNSSDETGFRIERANGNGVFATLATVAANATSYSDVTALPGAAYAYRVFAFNPVGDSAPSNTATVTTPTIPIGPNGVAATRSPLSANPPIVTVTWNDRSNNETGFRITRATNAAFTLGVTTFTLGPNLTTFADTTVAPHTQYWYSVSAFNQAGYSVRSNASTDNATTLGQLPAVPGNLTVTPPAAPAGRTSLIVSWIYTSNGAPGPIRFDVQRSNNGINGWTTVANNILPTSFTNTGLPVNTIRYYRVRAVNADGNTAWSNVVSGRTRP